MSDKEDVVVEKEEIVEEEYSEEELKAMEHGWAPKEEWKGDPEDWVSARTFNQKGELFGKIRSLERDRDHMKQEFTQATAAMVDMLKKAKETEYKRAKAELKKQKREAIEEGESAVAMDIDDQIEELTVEHKEIVKQYDQVPTTPVQDQPAPEFIEPLFPALPLPVPPVGDDWSELPLPPADEPPPPDPPVPPAWLVPAPPPPPDPVTVVFPEKTELFPSEPLPLDPFPFPPDPMFTA